MRRAHEAMAAEFEREKALRRDAESKIGDLTARLAAADQVKAAAAISAFELQVALAAKTAKVADLKEEAAAFRATRDQALRR